MDIKPYLQDIQHYKGVIVYIIGFVWILFASDYFAKYLQKIKLPLITGFLLTGIICGPQALGLITEEAVEHLDFINDLSLAFIAFAAGAELYLKELRSRLKSILWNTVAHTIKTALDWGGSFFTRRHFSTAIRLEFRVESRTKLAGLA